MTLGSRDGDGGMNNQQQADYGSMVLFIWKHGVSKVKKQFRRRKEVEGTARQPKQQS